MKKTLRIVSFGSACALAVNLFVGVAYGQGFGGMGSGGSSGFGGSSSGYGGGGTSGASSGSSGSSSSLFGSSGSGSSGSSSSLFNNSGSSGGSSSGGSSSGSSGSAANSPSATNIQTPTLSAGNTPIQRGQVITRDTSSMISSDYDIIGGQPGTGRNQFANMMSQIGRQAGQGGNFNQQGGRNNARPTIRIPLRLGFTPKPISTPVFTAKFENRMSKLSGISATSPIRVTMDGSIAVLTGEVASEQDRELAAGVASLEPEVESVRNELTVRGESPSDSLSPPPANP